MTKQSLVVQDTSSFAKSGLSIATLSAAVSNSPLAGAINFHSKSATRSPRKPVLSLKKLETGARVNPWLESMKASSPTHVMSVSSFSAQEGKQPGSTATTNLIIRLPSALKNFDDMMKASKGKQIVMFLDYDGTLSPIVDDPDRAFMSDAMRAAVRDVARYFPTAIVSGRCRDKVYSFVRLAELYYAGSHGMDIKGPAKRPRGFRANSATAPPRADRSVLCQPAIEFLPMIDEVYKALVEKTKCIPGSKVENNKFCVSVHFRCVEEKRWPALFEEVRAVLNGYPKLRLSQGRKVLEIRPIIKWDKGKALEFLLESLGFANCSDVLPVYIGDDRTDEDAFKVLRERGQGFGILVSKIPKDTNASYSLQEPAEVMDFLHRLVEWKRLSKVHGATM
ncbi:probable trehalose-phosphate phosphatase 6 [Nymphaea colorata]|nr:probable trehalose-phosphate phosphatase 6 [Nymphaea colorata]XP_031493365.1 probable trehalose-phosphate phosphatase 6 [Nymphaea colorata]